MSKSDRQDLTIDNLADFRQRFGTFHDSIVHSFHYDMFGSRLAQNVNLILGTRDFSIDKSGVWVNLTLEIESIESLILRQPYNYEASIIFRMNVGVFDAQICFNLFPMLEDADNILSYQEREDSRGTQFIIIGRKCQWYVSEYKERQ